MDKYWILRIFPWGMGWNLTRDCSLISHPIHYNFSGRISKTKPFLTTQAWFITKGDILWVGHRSRWKRSGIVELEQSWCSITPTPSWAVSKEGILTPKNSTSKPSQQGATTHLRGCHRLDLHHFSPANHS